MQTSRLTQKYQATVPQSVRRFLGLRAGDSIAFEIENDTVVLRKASPIDVEYARSLQHTLSEWTSKYDEEAYSDL